MTTHIEVRYQEGANITINMENVGPTAHPFPSFSWSMEGNQAFNSSGINLGYPSLTSDSIQEVHHGTYTLSAMNYHLVDNTVIGQSTGTVVLEVLCK